MREMTLFLVEFADRVTSWCEIGSDKDGATAWVDFKGRRIPYDDGKPLHHMKATHHVDVFEAPEIFQQILRRSAEKHLLKPDSDQGWIDDRGIFYGCQFYSHDDMAHSFFGCHVGHLELQGYVRIHDDTCRFGGEHEPTKNQLSTMTELGFYKYLGGLYKRIPERDQGKVSARRVYVPSGKVQAPEIGKATKDARDDLRRRRIELGLDPPEPSEESTGNGPAVR